MKLGQRMGRRTCTSQRPFFHPSIHPSVRPSVRLSVRPLVCPQTVRQPCDQGEMMFHRVPPLPLTNRPLPPSKQNSFYDRAAFFLTVGSQNQQQQQQQPITTPNPSFVSIYLRLDKDMLPHDAMFSVDVFNGQLAEADL